ncbi:MAG: GGDEF domain-containing protein [Alphaproteobacteria bacterium]
MTDQPPIAAAGTSGYSLFDNEERILAETEALLHRLEDAARTGASPLAQVEVTAGLRAIAEALRRSYAEERRLVRLSDRMQLDLQTANRRLAEQTSELSALNRRMVREVAQREALTRELEQLATIDALTGLANRRHLLDLSEREVKRAERHGRPLAVLLLDLDDFKRVNDTRGHAAGDAALHAFAALCRSAVRTIDLVGRLGGEEFAIVMPDTEAPGALLVAERIRTAAAETPVRHDSGEFIVTVSIGVAIRSGEGTDRLFARADKALYAAKHAGRNTVIVDHG